MTGLVLWIIPSLLPPALSFQALAGFLHTCSDLEARYLTDGHLPACITHTCLCLHAGPPQMTTAVGHTQLFDHVTLSPVKFVKVQVCYSKRKRKIKLYLGKLRVLCWASPKAVLSCIQDEGLTGLSSLERDQTSGFVLRCISLILKRATAAKQRQKVNPGALPLCKRVTLKECLSGQTGSSRFLGAWSRAH